MKTTLFIATATALAAFVVFHATAFFLLFFIFIVFSILEYCQTEREKKLHLWEEKKKEVDTVEDWIDSDYETNKS